MTARVNMLYVILEKSTRIDDIEKLMDAITQMRNVLEVKTHIATPQNVIAETRVRHEIGQKLLSVVYPEMEGKDGKT